MKIVLKISIIVLGLLIVSVVYFLEYKSDYTGDRLFHIDCDDFDDSEKYLIKSSYEDMMYFFRKKPGFNIINLRPNHEAYDYAPPVAYYYSEENKFWIIQGPGFGRREDTKFYGPFEGEPCVDYGKL